MCLCAALLQALPYLTSAHAHKKTLQLIFQFHFLQVTEPTGPSFAAAAATLLPYLMSYRTRIIATLQSCQQPSSEAENTGSGKQKESNSNNNAAGSETGAGDESGQGVRIVRTVWDEI